METLTTADLNYLIQAIYIRMAVLDESKDEHEYKSLERSLGIFQQRVKDLDYDDENLNF
jgi:hypothetical protein